MHEGGLSHPVSFASGWERINTPLTGSKAAACPMAMTRCPDAALNRRMHFRRFVAQSSVQRDIGSATPEIEGVFR